MIIFFLVLLTYFTVISDLIYDIIVEPPEIDNTQDHSTGTIHPIVFLPGHINGQYLIEGLSSDFMFVLGGVGLILMDLAFDRLTKLPTTLSRTSSFGDLHIRPTRICHPEHPRQATVAPHRAAVVHAVVPPSPKEKEKNTKKIEEKKKKKRRALVLLLPSLPPFPYLHLHRVRPTATAALNSSLSVAAISSSFSLAVLNFRRPCRLRPRDPRHTPSPPCHPPTPPPSVLSPHL